MCSPAEVWQIVAGQIGNPDVVFEADVDEIGFSIASMGVSWKIFLLECVGMEICDRANTNYFSEYRRSYPNFSNFEDLDDILSDGD